MVKWDPEEENTIYINHNEQIFIFNFFKFTDLFEKYKIIKRFTKIKYSNNYENSLLIYLTDCNGHETKGNIDLCFTEYHGIKEFIYIDKGANNYFLTYPYIFKEVDYDEDNYKYYPLKLRFFTYENGNYIPFSIKEWIHVKKDSIEEELEKEDSTENTNTEDQKECSIIEYVSSLPNNKDVEYNYYSEIDTVDDTIEKIEKSNKINYIKDGYQIRKISLKHFTANDDLCYDLDDEIYTTSGNRPCIFESLQDAILYLDDIFNRLKKDYSDKLLFAKMDPASEAFTIGWEGGYDDQGNDNPMITSIYMIVNYIEEKE